MNENSNSCEKACAYKSIASETKLIVITGGPGAGKTAVLEIMRKLLCEHVTVLPEAASILFGGGFWRLKSPSALKAAQKAIYHVQNEMQNLVLDEHQWSVGLCDRGTLDGVAYWPGDVASFCKELQTSVEHEYSRYAAVIHLRTPSQENGYNFQNPIRIESAEEAAKIDRKIRDIWNHHPHYVEIQSTRDFMSKVHQAYLCIQKFLPESCKVQLSTENI